MSKLLEELVSDIIIYGEELSTTLTINGSPEVYTLLEERGHGGEGTLYKAQRGYAIVAVKILDRRPKADERERFAFWQQLDNVSGVTHLLAHGVSSLELRKYAVVSDYVDGVNLEQLRAKKPLSEEAVRELLHQSATILGNIHDQGVLHRDLKPSNIMIDCSGHVSITDFGAVRSADVHTMTATMIGSPFYLAPEQYQKPDIRSDLYSLGLTFYYAMKGEHPPLMPTLGYKRDLSFEDIEGYNPNLISIVQKMCEHEPEKRYQNAREVLDALGSLEERVCEKSESTALVDPSGDFTMQRPFSTKQRVTMKAGVLTFSESPIDTLYHAITYRQLYSSLYCERNGVAVLQRRFGRGTRFILDVVNKHPRYHLIFDTDFAVQEVLSVLDQKDSSDTHLLARLLVRGNDGNSYFVSLSDNSNFRIHPERIVPEIVGERAVALRKEISDLEKRVRDKRNIAYTSLAVIGVGSAVALAPYVASEYFSQLGFLPMFLGSSLLLPAGASYAAFGHSYWRMRRELEEVKDEKVTAKESYLLVEWDPVKRTRVSQSYDFAVFHTNEVGRRLPTCAEQMSLLILGLEGRLGKEYKDLFDDMVVLSKNKGEWTSEEMQVVEKRGNIFKRGRRVLLIRNVLPSHFIDWEAIFRDYHLEAAETEIDITGMKQGHNNLLDAPNPLIRYLFSRPYKELPLAIQEEGGIYIPPAGDSFLPIVRCQYLFFTKPPSDAFYFRSVRERK